MINGKLVRDKIPEIITKETGKSVTIKILTDNDYIDALEDKLDEEVAEFHDGLDVEELVDICEVVLALAQARGISQGVFVEKVREKVLTNGGFSRRYFLVEED